MFKTLGNVTSPRVAAGDLATARAWLVRQKTWQDRLAELERTRKADRHHGRFDGALAASR
jgi:hypothetical protein